MTDSHKPRSTDPVYWELALRRESALPSSGSMEEEGESESELEFGELANLYVASRQLLGLTSPRVAMRRVKEILAQLIGAERYAIYLVDADRNQLVPVASEGLAGDELFCHSARESRFGEALTSGEPTVLSAGDTDAGTVDQPVALVPMLLEGAPFGLLVVYSTLSQKKSFGRLDHELFHLLGQKAGWALMSAALYSAAKQRLPSLEAFLDLSV